MCATSSNRGFTLLEILIAVALLSILAAALYGSYFTTLRARERVTDGMEARRELAGTLDLIRREVGASLYNLNDKRLRFVVEDRDNYGKPASTLELTTVSPDRIAGAADSGIRAVRYRLVEKGKQQQLQRREQDIFFEVADAKGYPQMERISAFLVECYDGSKWVRSWDTTLNRAVPKVLRVTVTVEEDGKQQEFSVLAPTRITGS